MGYSIEQVADVLGASWLMRSKSNCVIEHLSIDSRKVSFGASSLFFALKTPTRNGIDFVVQGYQQGVRNFIVQDAVDESLQAVLEGSNILLVKDTLLALQTLATFHREQFNYPVIGITGSNGKTIVKEWLNFLLEDRFKIVRSPRSFNSQVGVPLSVWEMSETANLGIFEAGISQVAEMAQLEKIVQPSIGILTSIGDAHDGGFESKAEKLHEKLLLFKNSKVLLYATDEAWIINQVEAYRNEYNPGLQLIRVGADSQADARIYELPAKEVTNGTALKAEFTFKGNVVASLASEIPYRDQAAIHNAGICLALLQYFGVADGAVLSKMKQLPAIDMRLQVLPAINRCTIINDSYSLDQHSLQVALDLLNQQVLEKTLILSDIPVLESHQKPQVYENMTALILNKKVARLITIGPVWKSYKHLLTGVPNVTQYNTTNEFIRLFKLSLFKEEAILIKGARAFHFEDIFHLLQEKVHQTRLEVNLTAIVHNQKLYRSLLKPGVKMMAMVKAFAYGSGILEIASVLQYHNIDYLAVAYADEGVALRNGGIRVPIMVMNMDEYGFETLVAHQLEPEIYSFGILNKFMAYLHNQGLHQYPIHIKLDTGMHRLGFEPNQIEQLASLLSGQRSVYVKSAFSHFTSSEDGADDAFTRAQASLLIQGCEILEGTLGYRFIKHIANSAAIARFPEYQLDMVRLGIGLYGVDTTNKLLPLETVASLKATIAQIKCLDAGETVGYNRKGVIDKPSRIATIRIGYADGFSRMLSNGKGTVWIHGKVVPVIGNVCMDMTMIDISSVPEAAEGDEVEIFGKHHSVERMAAASGTSSYEIFTSIGQRINRIYLED